MKLIHTLVLLPLLTACVSIDLPGVVSDTAKVTKDAYRSVAGKKGEADAAAPASSSPDTVSNTTIGKETQTVADLKQACVQEATAKLFAATGKEVAYVVAEIQLSTVNGLPAAHCRVTAGVPKPAPKP